MADSDKRIVGEGVELGRLFRFPTILRAVSMAFGPPRLVLGLLLVVSLLTAGRLWDGVTDPKVSPEGLWEFSEEEDREALEVVLAEALATYVKDPNEWPDEPRDAIAVAELIKTHYRQDRRDLAKESRPQADREFSKTFTKIDDGRPRGTFEATLSHVTTKFNGIIRGLVSLHPEILFAAAGDLFVQTPRAVWGLDRLFTVLYGLVLLVLVALAGGAVARMTAVDIARGERLTMRDGISFALNSWRRLIFSLLLPLVIAGILCALLIGGGWVLMHPWVDVLAGLLYGVALLIGFGVVFLMVGYGLGFSLLLPAVACENCDAADAQQRAYAYVLSRPLHLLGYGLVGLVGLALGYVAVSLFAQMLLLVTGGLVDSLTGGTTVAGARGFEIVLFELGPDRAHAIPFQWHSEWSAWLVSFWQRVVVCLVAAYVFVCYFGASTIIYLLMRKTCDGQDVEEIWQPGLVPGTMAPEPDAQGAGEKQKGEKEK